MGLHVERRRTAPHGAFHASQEGEDVTFLLNNRRFINGYEVTFACIC